MSRDRQLHEQILVAVCRVVGSGIASVNTQVENGIVQVSGVVDTPDERSAVERAIWSVPNVRAITQRLRSRRSYPEGPTDRTLATDVLALLAREGYGRLRVQVEEGKVTVLGQFDSSTDRAAISAAVATVPGVRGVWLNDAMEAPAPSPLASRIRSIWN
jgi:osmotically-inducible protein OsmY